MKMHRKKVACITFFIAFSFIFTANASIEKKLSYLYDENSVNLVSVSQINAIEFRVPIVQVNSPPNQLENIFYKNSRSISYVNNNKTMLFYLSSGVNEIQFMVTLQNGNVLSLHFKGDKSQGRIIRVPENMSGEVVEKNKDNFHAPLKKYLNYDMKIKELMRAAFFDYDMGDKWVKVNESTGSPYKNINIVKYDEWDNAYYKINRWKLCSNSKNILFFDLKKFINGHKILAATLSHQKLLPQQCAKLIILSVKSDYRAI